MAGWKERYQNLKSKHGHTAKKLFGGMKETGIDAAGGAAAGALEDFVMPHLPSQLSTGWPKVLVMAAAGHFIRKKNEWLGDGVVGAAGYVAYQHMKESGMLASFIPGAPSAPQAKGAGWLDTPGNAGAFQQPYVGAGALMGGGQGGARNNAGALMNARGIDDAGGDD